VRDLETGRLEPSWRAVIILLGLVLVGGVVWWFRRNKTGGGAAPALLPWPVPAAAPASDPGVVDGGLPADGEDARGQIVVRGLSKRYGALVAVDDLTFVVRPGRVTGFLGPNGAGKTTPGLTDQTNAPAHQHGPQAPPTVAPSRRRQQQARTPRPITGLRESFSRM
jgi:hypothetical protein